MYALRLELGAGLKAFVGRRDFDADSAAGEGGQDEGVDVDDAYAVINAASFWRSAGGRTLGVRDCFGDGVRGVGVCLDMSEAGEVGRHSRG